MFSHRPGRSRGTLAALLATILLAGGCTGTDDAGPSPDPERSQLPDRSVGAPATLEPKPVPMQVRVGRTAGTKLRKRQVKAVEQQVSRVLSDYFDAAYLAGSYPRAGHPGAFTVFTPGVRPSARRDSDLLTNATVARRIQGVVPRRKEARLDLLVPHRSVSGVTARIRLVFRTETAQGRGQRVVVTGRLLLSRSSNGPWRIFGYDVRRSATATKGTS